MKYTKRRKNHKTRKNRKQRKTRKARGGKYTDKVLLSRDDSVQKLPTINKSSSTDYLDLAKTRNPSIPSVVVPKLLFTISRVPKAPKGPESLFESNENTHPIFSDTLESRLNEIEKQFQNNTNNNSLEDELNNLFKNIKTERETIDAEINSKIEAFKKTQPLDTVSPPNVEITPPSPKESDRQIWFMEIPEVSNTSSQPKGGNDPQPMSFENLKENYGKDSMDEIVSTMTKELVDGKDTFTAYLSIDNNGTAKIFDSGNSATIQKVGKGSNNVLYNSSIFRDYTDTTKYILRISIRSEPWESIDILKNYIYETCYGVLAADNGIGPKVYDYGIFQSANPPGWYFYSMIERINGCDINQFMYKQSPSGNIPAESYCDSTNYNSEDTIGKFNEIINTSIDKINKAGTECGLLLMDSKPNNIMMTKDATKVYVIDYDKNFMLDRPTSPDEYDMYGKINVILFLSNAYYWIIEHIKHNDLRVAFGKYIFEKLQSEYYNHQNFKDIQTYIQTLYFGNPDFIQLCHHYSYTERGLLKIRYFTEYILSFDQMNRYAGDNILFFRMTTPNPSPVISYRYPILLSSNEDDIKNLPDGISTLYMDVDKKPATVIDHVNETYKTKYEMIKVYSLNRLCIMKANSETYIPFDQYTATEDGKRIYNHIAGCTSKYEEYINETLIPEFKKTYYMNTDNERIKTIVDNISIDNAVAWVNDVESKLRAQDSTSNQSKSTIRTFTFKKQAIYDVLNNTYIEHISLEAAKYRRALVYAFDQNYRSQDNSIGPNLKLIYRTSSIMNSEEDKDKHIVFFDTEAGICSGQAGTIAQLQNILNEKVKDINVSS